MNWRGPSRMEQGVWDTFCGASCVEQVFEASCVRQVMCDKLCGNSCVGQVVCDKLAKSG